LTEKVTQLLRNRFYPADPGKLAFWHGFADEGAVAEAEAYADWRSDRALAADLYACLNETFPYPVPYSLFYCRDGWRDAFMPEQRRMRPAEANKIDLLADKWLKDILSGESFFKNNKEYFTKAESHYFLSPDSDAEITLDKMPKQRDLIELYFFAKCKAQKLDAAFGTELSTLLTDRFIHYFTEPFVWQFLSFISLYKESVQDRNEIIDVCDYFIENHVWQNEFSFKGRTWTSIKKLVDEWHRAFRGDLRKNNIHIKWAPFPINNYSVTKGNVEWHLTQITSGADLYAEGRYMSHCCYSYARACSEGRTAIFSLRALTNGRLRSELSATLEVSDGRKLVQARGRFNADLHTDTIAIIAAWGKENNIGDPRFIFKMIETEEDALLWLHSRRSYEQVPEAVRTERVYITMILDHAFPPELIPEPKKTRNIRLVLAAMEEGAALQYVPDQFKTEKLCLQAIRKDVAAIQYIPNSMKTERFYLTVVADNGTAMQYVPDRFKTAELYLFAVENDELAISDVPDQFKTAELYLFAVKNGRLAISDVPDQFKTAELCTTVVLKDYRALQYVPDRIKTNKLCLMVLKHNAKAFNYIPDGLKTPEMCLFALRKDDGLTISDIPKHLLTPEIGTTAICKDPLSLKYVPNRLKSWKLCSLAVLSDRNALKYVSLRFKLWEIIRSIVR
jgi:hypothetical protein